MCSKVPLEHLVGLPIDHRNDMIFRFAKVPEDIVASYKDKKVKVETSRTEADEGVES